MRQIRDPHSFVATSRERRASSLRTRHGSGGAKAFLAIDDSDNQTILGFYSLSPASVAYAAIPDDVTTSVKSTYSI